MDPSNRWFYLVGGRRHGPVELTALVDQILHAQVPAGTLVWRRGFAEWAPAESVAEIVAEIPPPPPPLNLAAGEGGDAPTDAEPSGEGSEPGAPAPGLPVASTPMASDPAAAEGQAGETREDGAESLDEGRRRHRRHRHHHHHHREDAAAAPGARRWVDLLVPIALVLTLLLFLLAGAWRLLGPDTHRGSQSAPRESPQARLDR